MRKLVSVYLDPSQVEQLGKLKEAGYSPSALIRKWLSEGLTRMKAK
jgi:hypothetical protein